MVRAVVVLLLGKLGLLCVFLMVRAVIVLFLRDVRLTLCNLHCYSCNSTVFEGC